MMDGMACHKVEEWLNWINKRDREQMAIFLKEHTGGKVVTSLPDGRDAGQPVFFLMAAMDYYGNDSYYAVYGEVMHLPNGKSVKRRELFRANPVSQENLLNLLAIHGIHGKQAVSETNAADEHHRHNERGAGRKPLSFDTVAKIKKCLIDGTTIRETAKLCNVSTRTVQKYKEKEEIKK